MDGVVDTDILSTLMEVGRSGLLQKLLPESKTLLCPSVRLEISRAAELGILDSIPSTILFDVKLTRSERSLAKDAIDECIHVYADWHNHGLKIRTTGCYPEERYPGQRDPRWYVRLVKALKLDWILPLPAEGG